MSGGPLIEAALFLTRTLFSLYITVLLLRYLLQTAKADFHNPICQLLFKITQPLVGPLRRHIPSLGPVDSAMVLLLLALQVIELALLEALSGALPKAGALLVLAGAELLSLTTWVYVIALFAIALLSWIQPGGHNPNILLLHQLCGPILRPIRRVIPSLHGVDFSILGALVLLQLARILLVAPLEQLARALNH